VHVCNDDCCVINDCAGVQFRSSLDCIVSFFCTVVTVFMFASLLVTADLFGMQIYQNATALLDVKV